MWIVLGASMLNILVKLFHWKCQIFDKQGFPGHHRIRSTLAQHLLLFRDFFIFPIHHCCRLLHIASNLHFSNLPARVSRPPPDSQYTCSTSSPIPGLLHNVPERHVQSFVTDSATLGPLNSG
ncbi:unnamed protein product [Amaranthus hypochondriacus]